MMRLLSLLLSAPLLLGSHPPATDAPPLTHTNTDREFTDARRTREITALLDQAAKANTPLLVLDINSSSTNPELALPFAEHVARLKIRTVAYVNTAAVAGAALLALACDEIWMAPGSRIGAAPP
jgi:membrane-bound serine protease (ClpP class)